MKFTISSFVATLSSAPLKLPRPPTLLVHHPTCGFPEYHIRLYHHRSHFARHQCRLAPISTMTRKLAPTARPDSSLSPPPNGLQTHNAARQQPAVTARKRKAETTVTGTKRVRKAVAYEESDESAVESAETIPNKRARKAKAKETIVEDVDMVSKFKVAPKRTSKKKEEDSAPLEQRTVGSKLLVGAHVSIAGGVHNAIPNLIHIGANAFALFLKNQRKWDSPPLDPEQVTLFMDGCKRHSIQVNECCVPHGSYLVNLAHPDEQRKAQAYKSFHDDLTRCHRLSIRFYNFHPGNFAATTRENGIKLIAQAINKAHEDPATGEVIPLLETMATLGNTIGGTFQDLADIISHVTNKDRVGVCLDTCHVFAAGYDLRSPEAYASTMEEFDRIIGFKYLKALHINDSKAPLSSHRDLHANIGTGYLGLRSFHNLVNDQRIHGLPMVLETPIDTKDADGKKGEDKGIWAREIKLLEQLVGMDVESEEFKRQEKQLDTAGVGERERIGSQVKRKTAKESTPNKKTTKSKKKAVETSDSEVE
ncbi:unnamed protein product [Periconia digitata]|uniref:Apurinic-apyrimidinic endonuclease 1 n=1 Tax=Periconia digitata TaxID=1303443 RepID=A0A9W4XK50_9PLEO|nr:unnamed protein product [Periconia digitata]